MSVSRPLYLGDTFAVHHAPPAGRPARASVLMVPPFGWPDTASYRVRREWALHLASSGRHVLRIDLPGTGDSGGTATFDAWVDATTAAAAWLREQAPAVRVVAIGIGTGGAAAWCAQGIDDLVLWGVSARGRAMLRELRAFAALAESHHWVDQAVEPVPVDGLEVAGHLLPAPTVETLAELDLTARPRAAGGVLVLGRDGTPPDARLLAALPHARAADGPGFAAMTGVPDQAEVPHETIAVVDGWLSQLPPGPGPAAGPSAPAAREELALGDVTERPWSLGTSAGILAMPADPGPLGVVLLNAGAVRRTGPNRLWTVLAREWAARGVPVLRLDAGAIGDAGGTGDYHDVADLYDAAFPAEANRAVRALAASGVARTFVMGGLCTGGYWTFHAMLDEPGPVQGALMINPYALFYRPGMEADDDLQAAEGALRKLRDPAAWRMMARGGLSREDVGFQLRRAARLPRDMRDRRRRGAERSSQEAEALDRLRDEGRRLHLLLGRDEPLYDRLEAEGLLEELPERWPNLTLDRIPTTDHEFRPLRVQAVVRAWLDAALDEELARAHAGMQEATG